MASSVLFKLFRVNPLLIHKSELWGLFLVALSNAFVAFVSPVGLPNRPKLDPLLGQTIGLCELISIALSYAFNASSYLLCFDKAFPLLFQTFESCGLISIALSYAFVDSSNLFELYRSFPLIYQSIEFCGLISIALLFWSERKFPL